MNPRTLLPLLGWILIFGTSAIADEPSDDAPLDSAKAEETPKSPDEKKPKTIAELTEDSDLIDGLFPIYRDRKTGEVRMLLGQEHLDELYLYFTYVEDGVSDAGGLGRGSYLVGSAKAITLLRYYDRIDFVEENTHYYLDPALPISRSGKANVSDALLFSQKIEAEDTETCKILIKANDLFLKETLHRYSPIPDPSAKPNEGFRIGKLSDSKSKFRQIRNYPENTDVVVEYVYENDTPYQRGSDAVTDARSITIVAQHSFIKAPENPLPPRPDDARIGFFMHKITDLSSREVAPYRDVIERWRLEKKDPDAALSEPVKPIVYWMENTTPMDVRPIIQAAGMRWNEAFEQAGFMNALEIRIQPDDANWEAGDIRYNVIRWVSSPDRKYSGYGPSFFDPRSGEILGADIMFEYEALALFRQIGDFAEPASTSASAVFDDPLHCDAALSARAEAELGMIALEVHGAGEAAKTRLFEAFVYYLALHEIGHTLGLSHNFAGSQILSFADAMKPETERSEDLYASVMDYPGIPFFDTEIGDAQLYPKHPGIYDRWAIEYAYSTPVSDAKSEAERLESILARSSDPRLLYLNDADAMSSPGHGIDPRGMVFDLSSDAVAAARQKVRAINRLQPLLRERLIQDGDTYQKMLASYWICTRQFQTAADCIANYVGGIFVDRSRAGQAEASSPFTPVPREQQRDAMAALSELLFSPGAFAAFSTNAEFLIAQRRGWDHGEATEDPKLRDRALDIQKGALERLLHPRTLARITDSADYGNAYPLDRMLADLTNAIFESDLLGDVNTFRQNLQVEYVQRLIGVVKRGNPDHVAKAVALDRLLWIKGQMAKKRRGNAATQAHRAHILYRIETGLYPGL